MGKEYSSMSWLVAACNQYRVTAFEAMLFRSMRRNSEVLAHRIFERVKVIGLDGRFGGGWYLGEHLTRVRYHVLTVRFRKHTCPK